VANESDYTYIELPIVGWRRSPLAEKEILAMFGEVARAYFCPLTEDPKGASIVVSKGPAGIASASIWNGKGLIEIEPSEAEKAWALAVQCCGKVV